ncbi:flagellin hook IN motif-containing protein, partial [Vibrio metschnikovii]
VAATEADKDWTVSDGSNDLTLTLTDINGDEQIINITAKVGDDIEEVATYINGQTDLVQASVNEKGQL